MEPTRGFENRYRCRDGTYRWLSWSSSAPDARGRVYTIARDVTEERRIRVERERRRAEIRRSERRFRSFVSATAQVLWMADAKGSVVELSDTWSEFTGQTKEQVAGWGWADAVHPEDRPRVAERWRAHLVSREPLYISYRVRRRDGAYHLFDVRAVPVFDEDGAFVEWIGTCTDIEAARRAEAALVAAKERAEEMVRLKTSFLANMSHEIRTPLTSVIGFSEVLADQMEGPERRIVEMINRSGRRLLETLNSVLDLAQLESRSLRLRPERVVLDEVAEDVVALFEQRAEDRGISLDFVSPEAPVGALADRGAVLRVLTNLVSNAIKFTDEGGVTVSVGADDGWAWVRVADTGVGIAPSFLDHLFDEFRQESSGDARSHEGNGLGLAITKRLVELMEGDIAVESTKGEGAAFIVRLPAASRQET